MGLISSNKKFDYIFDGIEIKPVDNVWSNYRKNKIGYVFQENNLNERLTIKENIIVSATIAGQRINDNEIRELMEYVNFNSDINYYPNKLSGGEKQRISIACALAKRPEMIVADEKNTVMIIDILKKYAYENKKKVVIVTHNPQVYKQADVLYKIENKEIKCLSDLKGSKELEEEKDSKTIPKKDLVDKNKLTFSFIYRYNSQIHKKNRLKKRLIFSLLGFAIALTVIGANFGQAFVLQQRELLNSISKNELLVINKTAPLSDNKNVDDYISITESDIQKISKITGVEQINPLIEFRSNGTSMDGPIETSVYVNPFLGQSLIDFSVT